MTVRDDRLLGGGPVIGLPGTVIGTVVVTVGSAGDVVPDLPGVVTKLSADVTAGRGPINESVNSPRYSKTVRDGVLGTATNCLTFGELSSPAGHPSDDLADSLSGVLPEI